MSKSLPLVRLGVLRPLIDGLRNHDVEPEPVLESAGLTEAAVLDEDTTVHVMVIHQFLEACAKAVDDPTFCAQVASRLDPTGWPMIREAMQRAQSVGDFLNIYVSRSNQVATSVTAYLDVRGDIATFGETRLFRPTITPAQNDGFMISLALTILQRGLGLHFDPRRVILIVCDTAVLPESFDAFQVLRGDNMGSRIQFPSEWLSIRINNGQEESGERTPKDANGDIPFLSGFRRLLQQNIGNGGLSADDAARLVVVSRWKLVRLLASHGTSISAELARAKWDFAQDRLVHSDLSIEEISAALGYSDPSNFSRAFAKEMGQAPSKFRRAQRSQAA